MVRVTVLGGLMMMSFRSVWGRPFVLSQPSPSVELMICDREMAGVTPLLHSASSGVSLYLVSPFFEGRNTEKVGEITHNGP